MSDYVIGFVVGYAALVVVGVIWRRIAPLRVLADWWVFLAERRAAEVTAAWRARGQARREGLYSSAALEEMAKQETFAPVTDSYCDLERMIEERTKVNPRFPEMLAEAVKRREEEREIDGIVFKPGKPLNPVPAELEPQPAPANPPRGEAVWPIVIAEAIDGHEDPRLVALMRARHEQGIAKYGVPLSTHDGRDTRMDALQEALDLVVYLRKFEIEMGNTGSYWANLTREAGEIALALVKAAQNGNALYVRAADADPKDGEA